MRSRHWFLALIGAAGLSVALAVPALAHPLGNFTINRFSEIQLNAGRINVLYVVDYAEIPAFQEKQHIADDSGYIDREIVDLSHGLRLEVGGRAITLSIAGHAIAFLPGQGGLQTMRLQILLSAPAPVAGTQSATYHDRNYYGRLGWKEIVVQSTDAGLLQSSAPSTSVSAQLRVYPQDMLTSPLNVTDASFTFIPAPAGGQSSSELRIEVPGTFRFVQDRFAALISPPTLSFPVLAFSLLASIALGALHALSPGHGKAVMAGYLVGAKGTPAQAVALGITITATHTAGVFALGLITLYAASIVTPERLYPWLTLLSGLLVVSLGAILLWSRARTAMHGHDHRGVGQEADHPHHHEHRPPARGSLLALGVSGGLVPCPSALVVLLAAVSLHRVLFGLLLIVAFSAGLALVLTSIGLALAGGLPLIARLRHATGRSLIARSMRLLPVASAFVVTIAGLGLTVQAIPGVR